MNLGESAEVGDFVIVGAFVLGVILAILKIAEHFKQKPPAHEKYATKDELKGCKVHCDHALEKVERDVEKLDNEIKESRRIDAEGRRTIHRDIAKLREDTAAQQQAIEMLNQRQVMMDRKIDTILDRLPKGK